MNSEELEQSLRTEFESYLNTVVADMRQQTSEFQSRIQAEFDKHRSQFDEALKEFLSRLDKPREFDEPFKQSVTEHLRLARDEGAKISATAFAEAEDMQKAEAAPAKFDQIRDAIDDISSKDSQSSILKSLVQQAANFAPRGAFFIIKNEHFVGWKVFGDESEAAEKTIREVHFPLSEDTTLSRAVSTKSTVDSSFGTYADDDKYLSKLQFGQPDRMYAVPLVARGRGVAVMYADYGTSGTSVNVEALETLVRVAGLTVELLASTQTAREEQRQVGPADFENTQHEEAAPATPAYEAPAAVFETPQAVQETPDFAFSPSVSVQGGFQRDFDYSPATQPEPAADHGFAMSEPKTQEPAFERPVFEAPKFEAPTFEPPPAFEPPPFESVPAFEPEPVNQYEAPAYQEPAVERNDAAFVFDSQPAPEPVHEAEPAPAATPFETPIETFAPVASQTMAPVGVGVAEQARETAVEVSATQTHPVQPQARGRLSDRPVDLPIDVPEEERRLHNDARRFARLLVSEIKLYNEKKVQEGRQAGDLYDRLREAIDRSREMYDKRVQPPVASKFDYFHYELLNSLADGNADRLGSNYPGAAV